MYAATEAWYRSKRNGADLVTQNLLLHGYRHGAPFAAPTQALAGYCRAGLAPMTQHAKMYFKVDFLVSRTRYQANADSGADWTQG
jgi:hypothetical protein